MNEQAKKFKDMRSREWEMFIDECQYSMYCVRWAENKKFNSQPNFHFIKKEDAETFCELLKKAY